MEGYILHAKGLRIIIDRLGGHDSLGIDGYLSDLVVRFVLASNFSPPT
jgi:hypothetical protein